MKVLLNAALAALLVAALPPVAQAENVQRAAAVVNGIVISSFDVDQRTKMILSSSGGGGNSPAAQQRMRGQVLRSLIDEILQLKAAQDDKIAVSDKQIDESLAKIAQQNKTTPEAIVKSLEANGIYPDTLRTQIKAEIAWSNLVEERIAPRVNVTDDEVDQELKRIQANATKPQYLVSEIFIASDSLSEDGRAKRSIEQINEQLHAGTPFPVLAQQFSESATASKGGDLGWVQDGDVDADVYAALGKMQMMTVSPIVHGRSGYYILALRDKMRPAGSPDEAPPPPPGRPAGVPAGSIKLMRIVLGMPPSMTGAQKEQFTKAVDGLRQQIRGCQGLTEFAKQLRGVVVLDLPVLSIGDLSPEVKQAVANLRPSDVSPPYITEESGRSIMNLLVVCGDRPREQFIEAKAFKMPTREEVANRMFSEELTVGARRYMRDLRRDASIEVRDPSLQNTASN